ncbi:hypothetical protein [Xanthomarina gelatinilytica]|uniref:Kelch repeat-containing protein n=1 Tax=Xanthomarina gelatinilytica TaxID=1137281 RepID=UPI003AA87A76
MKTILKFYAIMAMSVCLFMGCDKDDDNKDNNPPNVPQLLVTEVSNGTVIESFQGNAMTEFNGKLWIAGGYILGDSANGVGLYNSFNGSVWNEVFYSGTYLSGFAPSLTAFNNNLWFIGGLDNGGLPQSTILKSANGEVWTTAVASAPFGGTAYHHTFVHNGKLFLVTGFQSGTPTHNKVWSTVDGENWTEENAQAFPYRYASSFVEFQNQYYIVGGYDGSSYLNDVYKSADGINWTNIATSSNRFDPIALHTTEEMNGKVWLIGGENNNAPTANLWYTINMTDWYHYTTLPSGSRALKNHNTLKFLNGKIWIFGGESYNISTNLWEQESKIQTMEEL